MKLAGKKALINGGNSGIGLATARLFIAEGAEVAITGRDQTTLDGAVTELGPKAHGYRGDVTVAEDRKRLFADLAKQFDKLDLVFANASAPANSTPKIHSLSSVLTVLMTPRYRSIPSSNCSSAQLLV